MELKTTCIMCPMGCSLTIVNDNGNITVSGNTCKRGDAYGRQELVSPKRVVTSLVRLTEGAVVSVKTSDVIDKAKIFEVLEALRSVEVSRPVHIGDMLVENICSTGVNIVATSERL